MHGLDYCPPEVPIMNFLDDQDKIVPQATLRRIIRNHSIMTERAEFEAKLNKRDKLE